MSPSVDKICQKRSCKSEIDSESFKLSISVTSTIRNECLGQEFRKETFGVCFRLHIFRKEVCSTIRTPNLSFPTDYMASLVAQLVNLPAIWRPGFNPWVGKIPWRRERLSHSSILPWRIPWTTVYGVAKSWTQLNGFHLHFQRLHCVLGQSITNS